MTAPAPTFEDNANLIDYLLGRCVKANGNTAAETWLVIKADETEELQRISQRLRRMARHEPQIKKMVMGG